MAIELAIHRHSLERELVATPQPDRSAAALAEIGRLAADSGARIERLLRFADGYLELLENAKLAAAEARRVEEARLALREALALAAPLRGPIAGSQTMLLVVTDDMLRRIVSMMLRARGYEVVAAENRQQALVACRDPKNSIRLVITDHAPATREDDVAWRIPGIRTLCLLAQGGTGLSTQGEAPVDFLEKPLRADTLIEKVREILGQSADYDRAGRAAAHRARASS